ncbi:CAF1 family ribonuclease [Musa troglodytarum]|uniref:poly(A)-specific ribonuclease n=1 Tax=Musa troglodytarum TaxID=320322 RepID=A0A9E7EU65_9LILI|nr:CAF1 family ribonuclease [Musa troglodytarum]
MPSQRGGGPPYLVVRRVWAWNLEYEFSIIASLVDRFSYVAFDTEFPGLLYSTGRPHRLPRPACGTPSSRPTSTRWSSSNSASPLRRLRPPPRHRHRRRGRVRVGVQLPGIRRPTRPHAPDSIDLLRSSGIDFDRLPRFGIDSGDFAALLCRSGLVAHPLSARWIAFHGCYDFAYLIKVLGNGTPLPDTLEEFLGLVNLLFGETVDLKYMMFGCEGLSGGLESVASTLGVPRQAGKSHQAGSDSLVTYQVYLKMKRRFFNDRDATVARHRGIIYGLHAC